MPRIKKDDRRWFSVTDVRPSQEYLDSIPNGTLCIAIHSYDQDRVLLDWGWSEDGEYGVGINACGSGPSYTITACSWAYAFRTTPLDDSAYEIIADPEDEWYFNTVAEYELLWPDGSDDPRGNVTKGDLIRDQQSRKAVLI